RASVAAYLEDFLRRGDECAYVARRGYRTERWSYREVAQTACRFARELEARGIRKGERVLLWGPNSAEWVCVFFGCAMCGVIVVPIDDVAATDFALRVHQQAGARLMVCSHRHVQASLSCLVIEELAETLSRHSSDPVASVEVDSSDTLEIVFTSGTTTEPKG